MKDRVTISVDGNVPLAKLMDGLRGAGLQMSISLVQDSITAPEVAPTAPKKVEKGKQGSYWKTMTPQQRKTEMARRVAMRDRKKTAPTAVKKSAKKTAT